MYMEPPKKSSSIVAQTAEEGDHKLHIFMFPWLAFGHLLAFLELAKFIAQKGHFISFISTPRNINRLPKLPPNLSSSINFVKLPLPNIENLSENAEATMDLPENEIPYLKKAYDGLEKSITLFLQSSKPDCLIYDFASYWLPNIATNLNIPHVFYSIFNAAFLGFLGPPSSSINDRKNPEDFTVKPNWVPFPSNIAFKLFEVLRIFDNITNGGNDVSDMFRFLEVIKGCEFVIVRSCMEFEPEWLKLVEEIYRKPVLPVGQLCPTPYVDEDNTDTWKSIKEWLDTQPKSGVVYVAFGSEARPSQDELTELAIGLELSGLPFFWVLRTSQGLPDGFEERNKGRGVVFTNWAPQVKILSHDSVGGFLNHGGWSSVVEALQFERPLVILSFLYDQGLNARLLEEKMVGYSIPRNDKDGSFRRESVAESLRLVMVDEEGKIYREKAKEMGRLFGDRDLQGKYIDNFLDYLKFQRRSKDLKGIVCN